MNEIEQTDVIWSGFHIAERVAGDNWILLYQVDAFYVELFFDLKQNEITGHRPFVCTGELEPYLEQITLPDFILH